jgi:hypothetical protein
MMNVHTIARLRQGAGGPHTQCPADITIIVIIVTTIISPYTPRSLVILPYIPVSLLRPRPSSSASP